MRIKTLQESEMTDEQRHVAREAASGKRGHMPAPMHAWIHSPTLAERAQKLGEFVRYDSRLESKLSELAILVMARFWTSHFEWYAHKREALKAGLDPKVVEAIRTHEHPTFTDARERIVHDYAMALLNERQISQVLHDEAVSTFGVEGVVELVGILGYYSLVAMTLNAFKFELPEGVAYELEIHTI